MYSLPNGEFLTRFDCLTRGTTTAALASAFIHGGRAVMTGSTSGRVELWDAEQNYVFDSLDHGDNGLLYAVISDMSVVLIVIILSSNNQVCRLALRQRKRCFPHGYWCQSPRRSHWCLCLADDRGHRRRQRRCVAAFGEFNCIQLRSVFVFDPSTAS